ncbi:MAG: zinc ribbon domain-containing protein [Candidatus Aminicenantes bacterium]|nr:zinc ribbon domain-containing protein [Candidatus Aminicenantes bacterium]
MEDKFKAIEKAFEKLKRKYWLQEITQQEFKEELKKLQIKDNEGRLWMIGSRSGRWYYFDGRNWVQSEPQRSEEKKVICSHCGFKNQNEARSCVRCGELLVKDAEKEVRTCPRCGAKLDPQTGDCPVCSGKKTEKREDKKPANDLREKGRFVIIRYLHPVSFLIFWGTIGILLGIVLGAYCGATSYIFGLEKIIPGFMKDFQGKLLGGIIHAIAGSFLGFVFFALLGLFIALVVNLIIYFTGGIKIKIDRLPDD